MKSHALCRALILLSGLVLAAGAVLAQPCDDSNPQLEKALDSLWQAEKPAQVQDAIRRIVDLAPPWQKVYARVQQGRAYSPDVETGLLYRVRKVPFYYSLLVPETYDPSRQYPVVFALHGGVSRPQWDRRGGWWGNYEGAKDEDRIAVFSASWNEAKWWQRSQIENLSEILRRLKREYNVDENRVSMTGISDGGTGAYFFAMRDATPWASFVPLIGHSLVLANRRLDVDGQMYIPNLINRPLLVINGGRDQLYPSARVKPFIDLFRTVGVDVEFIDKPKAGHSLAWWPEEKDRVRSFVRDHPRDPLPERVVWETEDVERYGRFSWLEITELGPVKGESALSDVNFRQRDGSMTFGRKKLSGRVELRRQGNQISIESRGVRELRLLLSPEEIDFGREVEVVINGLRVFQGPVKPDLKTLLLRAAEDQDRTMLFAAELLLRVPAASSASR